jgi:hypothetical protein
MPAQFENPDYLSHLDSLFAHQYFQAYDHWAAGHANLVPEAWRIAFADADERRTSTLGDMLLGMNAHISRDLPFALERAGLTTPSGQSARPDYDRVNDLLDGVSRPMLADEARMFDPGVATATLPVLRSTPADVATLLGAWRTDAWRNAERLLAAEGERRDAIAAQIERDAAGRGRLIEALTSNLVLGPSADRRDAYCRSQR